MITSKQRAYLRSLASNLDTIFQIGKGGITDEICKQIANALEARELIKARVLDNSGYTAKEAANEIAEAIGCEVVSCVGTKFVLYKESEKKKRIELYGEDEIGREAEKYEIILSKKDRDSLGASLIEGLRRTVIGKIRKEDLDAVCVSREIAEISGGFILRFGDIELDCSLSSIFAQVKEKLEATVSRKLFS